MKQTNPFPAGPVMMVSGVVLLLVTAALAASTPWLCMFLGLAGTALLFAGFRVLSGPSYILVPVVRRRITFETGCAERWSPTVS